MRRRAITTTGAFGLTAALAAAALLAPASASAAGTAVDDSYTVGAGAVFRSTVGLLDNDLGIDLSALIDISADPQHGAVTLLANGQFSYLPAVGYVGVDTFAYCIRLLPATPCISIGATVTINVEPQIERIGGADRYAVSAAVSARKFDPLVGTAYVASGEVFPDALSASAAAGAHGAPVLLVRKDSLPDTIKAELLRLKPQRIVVLGGTNTISTAVETALGDYTEMISRIGGADRYDVSAAVSREAFGPDRNSVYVASGAVFPDALSGSAAAGRDGAPVLLVRKDTIAPLVATELGRLSPADIFVLGGTATVSEATVTELSEFGEVGRIEGANRYDVSARTAEVSFDPSDTHTVYIASGQVFPDALSGSAAAIKNGAPVLLVQKDAVPASVMAQIDRLKPSRIVVLGGENTISAATFDVLKAHLGG